MTWAASKYGPGGNKKVVQEQSEYTGEWLGSDDEVNKALRSKVHVDKETGKITVEPLTVSFDGMSREVAQAYIDAAEVGWSEISLDLTLTANKGDLHLTPCASECSINPIDKGFLGAAELGGRIISYGSSQYIDTPVHELGHILGLHHPNSISNTGSIMGAHRPRSVTNEDLIRLRNLYEK